MRINGIEVRWMTSQDLPQMLRIEQRSFRCPWTIDDFRRAQKSQTTVGLVATDGGERVLGFVLYEVRPKTAKVLNLAVDPEARRRGIGTVLLERLRGRSATSRELHLEVEETNVSAQLFLRSIGARAVSVLRDHFMVPERMLDAYVFVLPKREEAVSEEAPG